MQAHRTLLHLGSTRPYPRPPQAFSTADRPPWRPTRALARAPSITGARNPLAAPPAAAAAAAAAALPAPTQPALGADNSSAAAHSDEPLPLPPPPSSARLVEVVPYLIKLALQERNLWWRLGLAFTCMVASKLAGISLPLVFKRAVDALAGVAAGGAAAGAAGAVEVALAAAALYCLLDGLRVLAKEMQTPLFTPVSQAVARRVAHHTFGHVLGLDLRFHLDRRTGRVSRILERGQRSIAVLYRAVIFTFLPTFVELLAVCALLANRFGPALAGCVGATFVAYVAWSICVTQLATDARKLVNELDNQTSSKAVDALLNYETLTLFGNQRLEVRQYDGLLLRLQAASIRTDWLAALLNAGQGLLLAGGLGLVLRRTITSGACAPTGGDLVLAAGLISQLWAPLQFLGWFYRELRAALVDMEDFFKILQTKSDIVDGTKPLPPAPRQFAAAAAATAAAAASSSNGHSYGSAAAAGAAAAGGNGHPAAAAASNGASVSTSSATSERGLQVELQDVHFGYAPERQILKGVSLRVAPGENVAVVGSSGSGKSTILKLVTRLYDVNNHNTHPQQQHPHQQQHQRDANHHLQQHHHEAEAAAGSASSSNGTSVPLEAGGSSSGGGGSSAGRVLINGADVRELKLADLRGAIAVVPQDTALFYDSIMENIRYGRPEATDLEVVEAARMARLHETVMAMTDQYSTVVGERGLKLSGGEKQRVAIARAFLRSPRLLVCDEATSALDTATERAIMDSLQELAAGRSAIFVAHRLSTVRDCNRIVVLRHGRVVEEGSHTQLMAIHGGEYARMWELQQAAAVVENDQGGSSATSSMDEPPQEEEEGEAAAGQGARQAGASMDEIEHVLRPLQEANKA